MPSKVRALRRGGALTRSEKTESGPLQILVVGFNDLKLESEIAAELKRLRSVEVVRLVDVVVVAKSKNGELVPVKAGELSQGESAKFGAIVGALVGLDDDDQPGAPSEDTGEVLGFLGDDHSWSVPDAIPAGNMAVVALLEHRWVIPLRDAVTRAGGSTLADAWVHPDDPITRRTNRTQPA
jgi:hypothetical protein